MKTLSKIYWGILGGALLILSVSGGMNLLTNEVEPYLYTFIIGTLMLPLSMVPARLEHA